jgi:GNAT superfamily N-acetyltransferase
VRSDPALAEFGIDEFLASLDALTGVYAAAMTAPPLQLPGRRAIMERHAGHTGFHAVVAVLPPEPVPHGEAPHRTAPHRTAPHRTAPHGTAPYGNGGSNPGEGGGLPGNGGSHLGEAGCLSGNGAREGCAAGGLVGFAYGFHGEAGQWWHDLVRDALAERQGRQAASDWMGDTFEVAEVHVHPAHQGRGTGHAMLLRLAADRPEHTAMLSTMDADTSAHRLYRGVGFADLLPGFIFPGAVLPYTIMGATLPLPRSCRAASHPGPASHPGRVRPGGRPAR